MIVIQVYISFSQEEYMCYMMMPFYFLFLNKKMTQIYNLIFNYIWFLDSFPE